jgi:hypothetical protein
MLCQVEFATYRTCATDASCIILAVISIVHRAHYVTDGTHWRTAILGLTVSEGKGFVWCVASLMHLMRPALALDAVGIIRDCIAL